LEQDSTRVEASVGSLASIGAADGPLGFTEVLGLGADVADSLADRHGGGEAHGAVHPRAIVRGSDGPWVLAAPGLAAGSKTSLAPELAEGDEPTPAGDVFALGATLVFALTGQEFVDGALGASEPGDTAVSDAPTAAVTPAGPLSLPDVMALFLDTLRHTLATDPAMRGTAAKLAGTLRQLRSDAERAMAPVVTDDLATRRTPAVAAGAAAAMTSGTAAAATRAIASERDASGNGAVAGAGAPGVIAVDGTTTATDPAKKKTFKQRFPALLAVAAILVAAVLGAMLMRKENKPVSDVTATGPSTTTSVLPTTSLVPQTVIVVVTEAPTSSTSSSSVTTLKPTTTVSAPPVTLPPTAPPPVTVPPPPAGTIGMTVDMSQMINCAGCPASLRSAPSKFAQILAAIPDKTVLWAQCYVYVADKTTGETHDDLGYTTQDWIYVVGPFSQGYVPLTFLGRARPAELPPCAPAPTSTTSTTAKP
jgi:hypothetical protein